MRDIAIFIESYSDYYNFRKKYLLSSNIDIEALLIVIKVSLDNGKGSFLIANNSRNHLSYFNYILDVFDKNSFMITDHCIKHNIIHNGYSKEILYLQLNINNLYRRKLIRID